MISVECAGISLALVCQYATLVLFGLTICERKFDKCIMWSDRTKSPRAQSKEVSVLIVIPPQVPENDRG